MVPEQRKVTNFLLALLSFVKICAVLFFHLMLQDIMARIYKLKDMADNGDSLSWVPEWQKYIPMASNFNDKV